MAMGEQPAGGGDSVMGPAVGGSEPRNGAGFGWWWHTPDDTLDKIDPDLLVRDAKIYVHAIARLLTESILPLDVARQTDSLRRQLSFLNEKLPGTIDLAPLIASVSALDNAAKNLMEVRARAAPADAPLINCALVAATRALVPMDYTSGDRFDPDPALRQDAYPVLDPIRKFIVAPPGSDASLFAAVAARRAVNRVSCALDQANEALSNWGRTSSAS
jgi:hypothetical protein